MNKNDLKENKVIIITFMLLGLTGLLSNYLYDTNTTNYNMNYSILNVDEKLNRDMNFNIYQCINGRVYDNLHKRFHNEDCDE